MELGNQFSVWEKGTGSLTHTLPGLIRMPQPLLELGSVELALPYTVALNLDKNKPRQGQTQRQKQNCESLRRRKYLFILGDRFNKQEPQRANQP